MPTLPQEKCVPCRGEAPAVTESEKKELLKQIPEWAIDTSDGVPELRRTFKFKDFRQALDFTNRLGELAEQEDHHPAILLEWGKATVRWSTHKIRNLHRNDFIMASKTDALYKNL